MRTLLLLCVTCSLTLGAQSDTLRRVSAVDLPVRIVTTSGKTYTGVLRRVDSSEVLIQLGKGEFLQWARRDLQIIDVRIWSIYGKERWVALTSDSTFVSAPRRLELADSGPPHRLSVSLATGFARAGSSSDVEAAMVSAGLDQVIRGYCFFGCVPDQGNPHSRGGGPEISGTVRYELPRSTFVQVYAAKTRIGETSGYREGSTFGVTPSVQTYALMAGLRWRNAFVSVGPALNVVRAQTNPTGSNGAHAVSPGAVASAEYWLTAGSNYFWFVAADYRYVARATIGPYDVQGLQGKLITTMPGAAINPSHLALRTGFGVRM